MKTSSKIRFIQVVFVVSGVLFINSLFAAPSFMEIESKGERNLKIIGSIYEKYPFMPAKKEYFQKIKENWTASIIAYKRAGRRQRAENFKKFYNAYLVTNDVLKDICIDMANYSDAIMDDFAGKLVEYESKQRVIKHDKMHNRYMVSRNEFIRADVNFKRKLYYYSAQLYDHGIEIMKVIYRDAKWEFPHTKVVSQERLS